MSGSLTFGSLGGLRIKFNVTWLIILPVLIISLALGWFPHRVPGILPANAWALAVGAALAFGVSVLLHEYAHLLAGRACGFRTNGTALYLFGSITPQEQRPASPATDVLIALSGPLASLALGVLCWIIALAIGQHISTLAALLLFLGVSNVFLGLFNLLPVFPLDGGRVLRGIFRATTGETDYAPHWDLRAGEAVAILCTLVGAWVVVGGTDAVGVWLMLVGALTLLASQAIDRKAALEVCFRDRTVRLAMNPHPVVLPASTSLQTVVDGYFLPTGLRAIAVAQIGELVGLVTLRDVHEWPREQWSTTPVAYVMVPRTRLCVAHPEERLEDALADLARFDVNQVPVVDEGNHLVGMLSRDIVLGFLGGARPRSHEVSEQRMPLRLPRVG